MIIAKKIADGNNHLFAYYTVASGMRLEENLLRDYLANLYQIIWCQSNLLNCKKCHYPTGKIDRKHLASLELTLSRSTTYIAPENDTQRMLATAWEFVLGIEPIGIHDNFFHIGGHSLKVLEILVQVKNIYHS